MRRRSLRREQPDSGVARGRFEIGAEELVARLMRAAWEHCSERFQDDALIVLKALAPVLQ
jgi:hypothetical protein